MTIPASQNPSLLPIVVGGFYRSGTTLLRRILDAHSAIHCGPEIKFFRDFHGDYADDPLAHLRFFSTVRDYRTREADLLQLFGKAFVDFHVMAARSAGKRRWADKNPENAIYTAEWAALLPDGFLFIHLVRNPLDVLASLKETPFRLTVPQDLGERIALYKRFREAGEAFCARTPQRSMEISYEALVARPETVLTEVFDFIGETFERGIAQDFNSGRREHGLEDPKIKATTSIHTDSIGRWQIDLAADEVALARSLLPARWIDS
ncbi:MAG: sulfotransferase [Mesorhizobium sp.]|nr:sulfotransferase [Mesorhizobium sp.]